MVLPTSPTWNLADFSGPTMGSLLSLSSSDLTITPATFPYFSYNGDSTVLTARSADGELALLDFHVAIPSEFTVEITARFPELPHNFADLDTRRVGLEVADDAGRGVGIYFSSTGMAISRLDDFGSATALPDTTDLVEEISSTYKTIRVAVDSGLGRAYVYFGDASTIDPSIQFILPVEVTPPGLVDVFKVLAKGRASQPSKIEIKSLRLANYKVIPDFPPTANAGPDRVAVVGQAVRFDGRSSFDLEGAPLSYLWRVIDAPFGSQYAAENSSGSTVDDGDADGFTDTLSFTANSLPAWVAAGDVLRIGSARHIIASVNNAGGTLTTEGETITDSLSDTPFRIIDQSALIDADTETPSLIPDVQGIFRAELTVNDGVSDSEESEVLANVVGSRSPLGWEPDVSPLWNMLGNEWGLIENRGVFEEAWRGVAQILSGKLLELWQYHYNYSLRDAQRTFQRKWLAFKSLITETVPEDAVISPRYGAVISGYEFESGTPSVSGFTLIFEYFTGESATETATTTVTLTGNTLSQIVSDVNTALSGTGISAYSFPIRRESAAYSYLVSGGSTVDDGDTDGFTSTLSFTPGALPSWVTAGSVVIVNGVRSVVSTANNGAGTLTVTTDVLPDSLSSSDFWVYRTCRLGFRGSRAFKILSTSTAATPLSIEERYNYVEGSSGAQATSRSYYMGDGIDLSYHGLERGDLLVLVGGQSFAIDRVLSDDNDPLPNQRVLLVDELPYDSGGDWAVPSVVTSEVDYEYLGAYPGDLVKAESYDLTTGATADVLGTVVAQKGTQLAVALDGMFGSLRDTTRFELRLLGVKRRKGLPLPEDVVSIPQLQEVIPQSQEPTLWKENIDYVLEPFYREIDGAPLPYLQFKDSVFIDADTEPPDVFWAELVVFSNDPNIEDLFGRLAGFLRDDSSGFSKDFNYVAGVAGLTYAQQRGPSVYAVRVGAQILLGQPFAEVAGTIEEINDDYSPTVGRMLVRDATGSSSIVSGTIRTYYYKKDPLDLTETSGLALNEAIDPARPWEVGDEITQFSPIGGGIDIVDLYNDPTWYIPFVRSGLMTELEKFHSFLVQFNLDLVSLSSLSLLASFVLQVKPTYTHPILLGLKQVDDDLDLLDDFSMDVNLNLYESICTDGPAYMYDDYRGDGTLWSAYDDGTTYYDALTDCPLDIIEFLLTMDWAGGDITYDTIFFLDTDVIDDDGAQTGTPGNTFTPTYDMSLPAGHYSVLATIKGGGIVVP